MKLLPLLFSLAVSGQQIELLHITDTHVMKIEGIHPALVLARQVNILSAPQLEAAFGALRSNPPDLILHTGDMLEAFRYDNGSGGILEGQIERFQEILKLSPAPVYLALGNRDVSWYRAVGGKQAVVRGQAVTAEARAAWRRAHECFRDGTYYQFGKSAGAASYLFAVLDNGDTADLELMKRQMAWLRELLRGADASALVLAAHVPLEENEFGQSVLEILGQFNRPVLVLAGHRHTDDIKEFSAAPRRVQVRTASFAGGIQAARRIVLREDSIEVYKTSEPSNLLLAIPVARR